MAWSPITSSLYPVGETDFAAEARGADGFIGGVAAGGIGQEEIFLGIDVVEQGFFAAVEIDAADGNGDHLGAAGLEGAGRFLEGLVFSRADDQAGAEGAAGDNQWVRHGAIVMNPPCSDASFPTQTRPFSF